MKIIVCGGRDFKDYERVKTALDYYLQNMDKSKLEIVHGDYLGVDLLAKRYAIESGYVQTPFPADWKQYGNKGGPIRNSAMAQYGEVCIAFWDGKSRGTADMIKKACAKRLKIKIVPI
jgi:hypothetical protein